MADEPKEPTKPNLHLVKPKGPEPPIVEPDADAKYETPGDEWVVTSDLPGFSMQKLAKKWNLSRRTLYRMRKREGWDARKLEFQKLVEEKKRRLAEAAREDTERPDPASSEIDTPEALEAARAARVDEGAADKKARAEIVMHSIGYAMAAHLAKLMGKDHWPKVQLPTDGVEAFKMARYGADFFEKVIGKPEPPPKPQTVFEVRIEPKGGAIQTIERGEDETLEQALERLDAEYAATKARLLEAHGGPPPAPRAPVPPGVPTIDGEPVQ